MGNTGLPKLKVRFSVNGKAETEILDLEGVRKYLDASRSYDPFSYDPLFIVEGHACTSYKELVQLVNQSQYKDKELIEVALLSLVRGG